MKITKLVLVLAVIGTGASVYAADDSSSNSDSGNHHRPPEMTAAQKACFTDNGLTAPGAGERPKTRPDEATMEKVHACLEKNGFTWHGPHHGHGGRDGGRPSGPPPEDGQSGSSTHSSGTSSNSSN